MKLHAMIRYLSATLFAMVIVTTAARAEDGSWNDLMRGSGVVVDHQPLNTGGPSSDTAYLNNFGELSWQRLADDFILTEAATIGVIRWWGFYHLDNPPATEAFRIRVYGSRASDGIPDESNMIVEHLAVNPSRIATGRTVFTGVDPDEYVFETIVDSAFELSGGQNHWLEIVQLNDPSTLCRWEVSQSEQNSHAFVNEGVGDWTQSGISADTAYQLIAIPEPASSVLMCAAGGAICLGGWGSRLGRRSEP